MLGGSAIKKAVTGYTESDHDLFMHKFMADEENIAAYCTPGPKPKTRILQQAAYVKWNKSKPNGFAVDGEGTKTKTGIADRQLLSHILLSNLPQSALLQHETRFSPLHKAPRPSHVHQKQMGPCIVG